MRRARELGSAIGFAPRLVFLVALLAGCDGQPAPRAQRGHVDLSAFDIERDGPVHLDGEWEMRWEALDFRGPAPDGPPRFFEIPGAWAGYDWHGKPLPKLGYAAFRLRMNPPLADEPLGVKITGIFSAFTLTVDGRPVAAHGTVSTRPEESIPSPYGDVYRLPPMGRESEWVLAVSSFHTYLASPPRFIVLDPHADLEAQARRHFVVQCGITAILVAVGLFHLGMFGVLRSQRYALYFGLMSLVLALRIASTDDAPLLVLIPDLHWVDLNRIVLGSWLFGPAFTILFVSEFYPREFPQRVSWVVAAGGMVLALAQVPLVPPQTSPVIQAGLVWSLVAGVYLVGGLALAVGRRRDSARGLFGGVVFLVGVSLSDMIYFQTFRGTGYLLPIALPPLALALLGVHLRRFAEVLRSEDRLRDTLAIAEASAREAAARSAQVEERLDALRRDASAAHMFALTVKVGSETRVVPFEEIQCILARGRKTAIVTMSGEHEVNRPLKELEPLLPSERFMRVHRQCIVHVAHVAELAHVGGGVYVALLRGREKQEPVPVSRAVAAALRARLGLTQQPA